MLLTVCIEAGRSTLTHTSWTGLTLGSRKWMSGQAAALAARDDRWMLANLIASSPLREPSLLSVRRPPSPLDFYLSWMSPVSPPGFPWSKKASVSLTVGAASGPLMRKELVEFTVVSLSDRRQTTIKRTGPCPCDVSNATFVILPVRRKYALARVLGGNHLRRRLAPALQYLPAGDLQRGCELLLQQRSER